MNHVRGDSTTNIDRVTHRPLRHAAPGKDLFEVSAVGH